MDSHVNKFVSEIESLIRDNSQDQWECSGISTKSKRFDEGACMMKITLDIFVRLHQMLNNFIKLLKFRGPKFCGIDYDKIPLNEALDVAVRAMMAAMCKATPKRPPSTPVEDENACPGCFKPSEVDCVSCRSQGIPKVDEVDRMLGKMGEPRGIENLESYVKEVLRAIATLTPGLMIDRLNALSDHLKKLKNKLVCCGRTLEGSLMEPQINSVAEIVSEFIREYGQRKSRVCPCRTICRFCGNIVNTVDRRRGIFCCEDAGHLNYVWKEWVLRNTIQGVAKWDEDTILSILDSMKEKIIEKECRPEECSRFCQYSKREFVSTVSHYEGKADADGSTDLHKGDFQEEKKKIFSINDQDKDKMDGKRSRDLDKVGRRFREPAEETKRSSSSKTTPRDAGDKFRTQERFTRFKDGGIRGEENETERYKKDKGKRKTEKKDGKERKGADGVDREEKRWKVTDHEEDTAGVGKRKKRERSEKSTYKNEKLSIGNEVDDDDSKIKKKTRKDKIPKDTRDVISESDDKKYKKNTVAEAISKAGKGAVKEHLRTEEREGRSARSKEKVRKEEGDNDQSVEKGKKIENFSSENTITTKSIITEKSFKRDKLKSPKSKSSEGTSNLIEYRLSNVLFANLGWTIIPINKIMQKIVWYQVHPTKPHVNWFKRYSCLRKKYYDDEKTMFLNFQLDGDSEVYYPNGKLAIRVHKPKGQFYDMYTVFTPGGKDNLGVVREPQIIAVFDSIGNGIVINENCKVRLKYNQNGGICLDNPGGLPFAWIWNNVRRKPVVISVYTEPNVSYREMELLLDKSMKDKESSKLAAAEQASGFLPIQESCTTTSTPVKTICLKLNKHLSLRILDRKNVNLQFFAGNRSIRIELGTEINPVKEESSYFVDSSLLAEELFKCKFSEKFLNNVGPESGLYDIAKEYRKIKKIIQQRNTMMAKYKPNMYPVECTSTSRCPLPLLRNSS